MEPAVIVVLVVLHIAAAVVTALKGKPWFLLLGLVITWFWVFGSLRLAKPESWWSRRFYGGEKLQLSRVRFSA
ncbi:MAG TPA: hypothetical protein VIA10_11600 [Gaiellaceae bacterium]